jgi:hypothetical protein
MTTVSGIIVVDLARYINAEGCIPAEARRIVGKVLAGAPLGLVAHIELGDASWVDGDVVRALVNFVPLHPMVVRGSNPNTVSRLVRLLRGERDDLLGGVA